MITKYKLFPCWVESQTSVTNHGKDITEKISDFRAAPEDVGDLLSNITAKLAIRRDIWYEMTYYVICLETISQYLILKPF